MTTQLHQTEKPWHVSYDEEPSCYEPVGSLLCPDCGEEYIYFPGCEPW